MCGIAGIWFSNSVSAEILESHARKMGDVLAHRGPDADGFWVDAGSGAALAHRRLSILDLSESGSQPMHSHCGRYVIVYNGECYNFPELREELVAEGCSFRGGSDTEIILEACAAWGVRRTLGRLNGMFAFALWDKQIKELVLARDRVGIKPLYYGWSSGLFLFGSELKSFRAVTQFQAQLNLHSLGLFFQYGYIPAPHSIYQQVFKLPAAHYVLLKSASDASAPECYWPLVRDFGKCEREVFTGTMSDAREQLDSVLRKSVRGQMVADVPLGAFLSGGIDSSTVVALMQAQSSRAVKTFTIGFEESEFNEADSARRIARHLQTDHTEMLLTSAEAQKIVPDIAGVFDEPFADASQIPTFAVSRLARSQVTVSLSGDGGDELFVGYSHYPQAARRLERMASLPAFGRRMIAKGAHVLSEHAWDGVFQSLSLAHGKCKTLSGYKVHKYASMLGSGDFMSRYELMHSRWFAPGSVVCGIQRQQHSQNGHGARGTDTLELMAAADLNRYLPDDVLTKLDRTSMAVSLESRVPLLDHKLVEFALSLPLSYKRRNGEGKILLRQVLEKYVPREFFERPKKGFSVPVCQWIRGPLRSWAEDLLETGRCQHADILNADVIRTKWHEHLDGRRNWVELLWPVLMFESWAQAQG